MLGFNELLALCQELVERLEETEVITLDTETAQYYWTATGERLGFYGPTREKKELVDLFQDLPEGYTVYVNNHGWNEHCLRIDTSGPTMSSTFLIKHLEGQISISCMCIFDKKNLIEVLVDKQDARKKFLELSANHQCTPWPG